MAKELEEELVYMAKDDFFQGELGNLLLNMSGGLLPEHLDKEEQKLLQDHYGDNWFEKLGYKEPLYKKPLNC